MLCFWFCRGRFRVFQKYVYKIWSPNPAGQLFGVCFFNIWTSKSSPRMVCFLHFDSQICFNAVRFSLSQLPKVVRHWCVLNMSTSTCASRHNCVHFLNISAAKSAPDVRFFLISHLPKWLRTHRFSEPTFRPSGATKHWKKDSVLRLFYPLAHLHLLSSDFFFSDLLSTDSFSSLTLPTSAFPSVHTVGSLTPIFSSIIYTVFSTCIYIYTLQVMWHGFTTTLSEIKVWPRRWVYVQNCIFVVCSKSCHNEAKPCQMQASTPLRPTFYLLRFTCSLSDRVRHLSILSLKFAARSTAFSKCTLGAFRAIILAHFIASSSLKAWKKRPFSP